MKLQIIGNRIIAEHNQLTSGSVNWYEAEFNFDSTWNGMMRTVVFQAGENKDNSVSVFLGEDLKCLVPWEVLQNEKSLYVSVFGTLGKSVVLTTNYAYVGKIDRGADRNSVGTIPPTPDIYQQILEKVASASDAKKEAERFAQQAAQSAENVARDAEIVLEAALQVAEDKNATAEDRALAESAKLQAESAQKEAEKAKNSAIEFAFNALNSSKIATEKSESAMQSAKAAEKALADARTILEQVTTTGDTVVKEIINVGKNQVSEVKAEGANQIYLATQQADRAKKEADSIYTLQKSPPLSKINVAILLPTPTLAQISQEGM